MHHMHRTRCFLQHLIAAIAILAIRTMANKLSVSFHNKLDSEVKIFFLPGNADKSYIMGLDAQSTRALTTYKGHRFEAIVDGTGFSEIIVINENDADYVISNPVRRLVDENGVLQLYNDTFQEEIEKNRLMIIKYCIPWLGDCVELQPAWSEAARYFARKNHLIKFAEVDLTLETSMHEAAPFEELPMLKFSHSGQLYDYAGELTSDGIISWIEKRTGSACANIVTVNELKKIIEKRKLFVLGVFEDKNSPLLKKYKDFAASDNTTITFSSSVSNSIRAHLGIEAAESIILFKNFDEGRVDFSLENGFDHTLLQSFISENSIPVMFTYSSETAQQISKLAIQHHAVFFSDSSNSAHQELRSVVYDIAKTQRGKLVFIDMPSTETKTLEFFGLEESDLPAFLIFDKTDQMKSKYYLLTEPISSESVSTHIKDFFDDKLEPFKKSEEVQIEDTAEPVIIVKRNSFNELVVDNTKDILIKFYAPWCAHCKKLAPYWDELGNHFKENNNIVIAKCDATKNDIDFPGIEVSEYPTIYFLSGKDKANPVKYNLEDFSGTDDLIRYIEDNASNIQHIDGSSSHSEL